MITSFETPEFLKTQEVRDSLPACTILISDSNSP
jgi:hypothetical protein